MDAVFFVIYKVKNYKIWIVAASKKWKPKIVDFCWARDLRFGLEVNIDSLKKICTKFFEKNRKNLVKKIFFLLKIFKKS